MANHLRRLATLPEDLSSVAHTHAECLQAPITLDSEGSNTFLTSEETSPIELYKTTPPPTLTHK